MLVGIMSKIRVGLQRLFTEACITNSHLPLLSQWSSKCRSLCNHSPIDDTTINEFNKELEFVFGQPPPALNSVSHSSANLTMEEKGRPSQLQEKSHFLSHVDAHGNVNMVDVSEKPGTKRMAIASCKVLLGEIAFRLVAANQVAKGDVLNVAKIAGIYGAKHTGDLIPLCHNIMLSKVDVDLSLNEEEHAVEIKGEVTSVGQTGVEMEAMSAVSVAGLTVYDMCKAVSKDIQITNIQLEMKMGGRSGDWVRNQ